MSYNKQTWSDYPSETTPVSASRLNHMEDGISNAATVADQAKTSADSVPEWAKASSKPTYTASEVGAVPNDATYTTMASQVATNKSDITTLSNEKANQTDVYGSDAWSDSASYTVGQHCIYNGKLYRCKVACQGNDSAPPNTNYWERVSVGSISQNLDNLRVVTNQTIYANENGIASIAYITPQNATIISAEIMSNSIIIIPESNLYFIKVLNYLDLSPVCNKTLNIKITYIKNN